MNTSKFKETFIPYHEKLYRVAFRFLKDQGNAEDIVQETYIKLWNKRHEISHIENMEAYAVTILRNTCLDFLRKKKEYFSDYELDMPETGSLMKEVESRDELTIVKEIMEKLPEQQRLVMQMRHWEHYSDKEIEEITGMSQINIRVTASRARKAIKDQYLKIAMQ